MSLVKLVITVEKKGKEKNDQRARLAFYRCLKNEFSTHIIEFSMFAEGGTKDYSRIENARQEFVTRPRQHAILLLEYHTVPIPITVMPTKRNAARFC